MLVYSKVNAIIPSDNGRETVRVKRGEVAEAPEWAAATKYFQLLAADGQLVTTSKATADKDAEQAEAKKPDQTDEGEPDNPDQAGEDEEKKPDKPEKPSKPGKGDSK